MDMDKVKDLFTTQGRDTLESVGVGGGQAGPPRPSSSDRGTCTVGDQAVMSSSTTGSKEVDVKKAKAERDAEEKLLFGKSKKIERSPPLSGRDNSHLRMEAKSVGNFESEHIINVDSDAESDTGIQKEKGPSSDEDNSRKRKRIRMGTPPKKPLDYDYAFLALKEVIRKIHKATDDLDKFCRANKTVHVPVKNMACSLKQLAMTLNQNSNAINISHQASEVSINKETRDLEQELAIAREERDSLRKKITALSSLQGDIHQVRKTRIERRNSVNLPSGVEGWNDIGTQTEDPDVINMEIGRAQIGGRINKISGETDLQLLLRESFPPSWSRIEDSTVPITTVPDREDIAVFSDMMLNRDNRLISKLAGTSQTIKNYIKEGRASAGKIVKLKAGANIQLEDREISEERYVYFVGADLEKSHALPLLESARRLRKMCEDQDRTTLHVTCVGKMDILHTRKVIECAFWDFGGTLVWHSAENRRKIKPEPNRDDAVIIDTGEETYADLLRKVKSSMANTKEADIIKNASKTRNGHLKLTIDGKRGSAIEMANYLKLKVGPKNIRAVGSVNLRKVIQLYGMDELTTEEDVRKEIARHANCPETEVTVRSLKPLRFGGLQMTTVLLAQNHADKLTALGEIRIGLSCCRVKLRPDLLTCFRCWETGHFAAQCKGPDRSGLCRNCAQDGHQTGSCSRNPRCPVCEVEGHRANTLACPKHVQREKNTQGGSSPEKTQPTGQSSRTPARKAGSPKAMTVQTPSQCV